MRKEIEFIKWLNLQLDNLKKILMKKYCIESVMELIGVLLTLLLGMIIESAFYEKSIFLFLVQIILYISLVVEKNYFLKKNLKESKKLQKEIHFKVRKLLYGKELRINAENLKHITSGENLQLFTQDIDNIYIFFDDALKKIVTSLVGMLGIFFIVCFYNWVLAVVILTFSILVVWLTSFSKKKYQTERKKFRKHSGEYLNWINEHLRGIKDIRINQSEEMMEEIFEKYTNVNLKQKERIRFIEIKTERTLGLVLTIFTIVFWTISAYMISNRSLTVGVFYVINKYFHNMIDCISTIVQEKINIQNYLPGCEKLRVYCELECEQEENMKCAIKLKQDILSELHLDRVSFSFENKKILDEINFSFKTGKMNVIVGANGVGKTTLLNLILRFYHAESGHIEYGENIIEQYSLSEWRDHVGYVQQDNIIFEGSIKDNILLYAPGLEDGQIWKILKIAGLYEDVMSWEENINTNLLEGKRLSEGQKQRVAIARIIAKNPSIILMDEPTANLDYETEKAIILDIKKMCKEKILIIITHRETVARYADEIVIIDAGKVVMSGIHSNLVKECEIYKKLFDM